MTTAQRAIVIGKPGTTTSLQLFGFGCRDVASAEELTAVIDELERERSRIGMVLLTSDIEPSDRQWKKLHSLQLPTIIIPIHADQRAVATTQMEKLIEKAVGMKLDFLTTDK